MKKHSILISYCLALLILPLFTYTARGEDQAEALRSEIDALRSQLEEQRAAFETQIQRLEAKIEARETVPEKEPPSDTTESIEQRLTALERQPEAAAPVYVEPGRPDGTLTLPDISIIGDIRGEFGPGQDGDIFLEEIELAIGGFLYPQIRADVYIALHKHGDEYEVELEEAFVSFLNLGGGFAGQAGKKLIGFGKLNPMHEHAWNFVSRPLVLDKYLGDHGLAGNGVNLTWLAPLPWFLQLELGVWSLAGDGGDDDHGHDHAPPISGNAISGRLWSGFPVGNDGELEIGLSTIHGKGDHHEQERDRIGLYGMDLTYSWRGKGFQRLLWRNEAIFNDRERATHDRRTWGFYSAVNWRWDQYWDAGLRYDWVEPSARKPKAEDMGTFALTRSLTEETRLRLELSHDFNDDYMATIQFIFGLGPHAHPLE